jgi:hypothetical protein
MHFVIYSQPFTEAPLFEVYKSYFDQKLERDQQKVHLSGTEIRSAHCGTKMVAQWMQKERG